MTTLSFSHPDRCAEIIRARKPGFTPRVTLILGSGLGELADQMTDAVMRPTLINQKPCSGPCW